MLEKLKSSGRYNITILLFVMTLFCFTISITRYIITDSKLFLFLNWNLFLAIIPWLISSLIIYKELNKKIYIIALIFSWLLFSPNSPYILTDLFHLRRISKVPIWFDLAVILSFAWTGLMYGFISLMNIEILLKRYLSNKTIVAITFLFFFLASFGVYLGRYSRWNSWDIVRNPLGLSSDIIDQFANPFYHYKTWGMTIMIGLLLNMIYFSIKLMKAEKSLA